MARGTGASAGIGIGKAAILREEKLVIEKWNEDAEAEKERFKSGGAEYCGCKRPLRSDSGIQNRRERS